MCPLLTDDKMFAFIVPSPKQQDLRRDGRHAIHSFPKPDNEDAFYVTGMAVHVDDSTVRSALSNQFVEERSAIGVPPPSHDEALFSFSIEGCLLTRTAGHGDPHPSHTIWRPV
jgi:hypothetical protein